MNSYLATEITITRQAGDTGSIVFTVPVLIDLPDFTEVKFQVFKGGITIIDKRLTDSVAELTVSGQTITIELWEDDTQGYVGTGKWECEISGNPDDEIITIGKGDFVIVKERIL
jgi:hypothetical protein